MTDAPKTMRGVFALLIKILAMRTYLRLVGKTHGRLRLRLLDGMYPMVHRAGEQLMSVTTGDDRLRMVALMDQLEAGRARR